MTTTPANPNESIAPADHRPSPADAEVAVPVAPDAGPASIYRAAEAAGLARRVWAARDIHDRADVLRAIAAGLEERAEQLAGLAAIEVGKPVSQGSAETRRAAELLRATAERARDPIEHRTSPSARCRFRPVGVVGLITPYNNPIAVPIGKIAPALLYGNAVVWKPSPLAEGTARVAYEAIVPSGLPAELVGIVFGGEATATAMVDERLIDAVSFTGSTHVGRALHARAARREGPAVRFQGELGGNNAAIVWADADLDSAAAAIASGAFGFAGQRCTANRRVIVADASYDRFMARLIDATRRLVWGDPRRPEAEVGPVISDEHRSRLIAALEDARSEGCGIFQPHAEQADADDLMSRGAYLPPTIVTEADPESAIVTNESFGPILVAQRAATFDEAIALHNGVDQGLVGSLFTPDRNLQEAFLDRAEAGILKINASTADADALSPFAGWKASMIGPAEHGPSDREFYTRTQTIYGADGGSDR